MDCEILLNLLGLFLAVFFRPFVMNFNQYISSILSFFFFFFFLYNLIQLAYFLFSIFQLFAVYEQTSLKVWFKLKYCTEKFQYTSPKDYKIFLCTYIYLLFSSYTLTSYLLAAVQFF